MLEAVLFMVIEDATNIMKVVKGILVIYEEDESVELGPDQKPFKINDEISVYKFAYAIENSIFKIFIKTGKTAGEAAEIPISETNLISRK